MIFSCILVRRSGMLDVLFTKRQNMMENIDRELVLIRYFERRETLEEYQELERWYDESEAHRQEARRIYQLWYAMQTYNTLQKTDAASALQKLDKKLQKRKRLRYLRRGLQAAAGIALLAGFSLLYLRHGKNDFVPLKDVSPSAFYGTDVNLIFSGNEHRLIPSEDSRIVYQDGKILVDSTELDRLEPAGKQPSIAYHQLIVPYGKRSSLTLADGSSVWVNSGSRLVFPATFNDEHRKVYVEGEAYFEVAHDNQRPFIVQTKNYSVRVLGTKFNVSAYHQDEEQSVVLAGGKVEVKTEKGPKYELAPDEMLVCNPEQTFVRHVDASIYTSWIQGVYIFKSQPLSTVAERLSRYYGKEIVCEESVENILCSRKLELKETLPEMLDNLVQAVSITWIEQGSHVELRRTNIGNN